MQKRSKELREQATQIAGLGATSAMRACIFCGEEMHQCEYGIGVQLQTDTLVYMQTEQLKSLVRKDAAWRTEELLSISPQLTTFAQQRRIVSMMALANIRSTM